jgi:hypothetical protein
MIHLSGYQLFHTAAGGFSLDLKALVMLLLLMRFAFVLLFVVPFHVAVDIVVCDASFISLQTVLPPAMGLVKDNGILICLVKPQVSKIFSKQCSHCSHCALICLVFNYLI